MEKKSKKPGTSSYARRLEHRKHLANQCTGKANYTTICEGQKKLLPLAKMFFVDNPQDN
jgi:hypothetical protein